MKQVFELQLPDLLYFVKQSCHENLHDTLNEVRALIKNLSREELPHQLQGFLTNFIHKLQRHLALEENNVFPFVDGRRSKATAALSIDHLLDDHDQMKEDLLELRKITENYQLPDNDHFTEKLREMDRIILNHIQIENHILFPMILQSS